jgi:hypothetical protein
MPSANLGTATAGGRIRPHDCGQSHEKSPAPCPQISDPEGILASLVKDYGGY